MAESVQIELQKDNIRALAKSAEMQKIMMDFAEQIAADAGEGYVAEQGKSQKRAHAVVMPVTRRAIRAEYKTRALTRAYSAAIRG